MEWVFLRLGGLVVINTDTPRNDRGREGPEGQRKLPMFNFSCLAIGYEFTPQYRNWWLRPVKWGRIWGWCPQNVLLCLHVVEDIKNFALKTVHETKCAQRKVV